MKSELADSEDVALHSPLFTSDAALRLEEARTVSGRRGATVVLMIGEVGAGKSTLLVELWTQLLLRGSLGGHCVAGSRTALAFEERSFYSRLESGAPVADTMRTHESDDGFLHLRIRRPDRVFRELLLADFSGEHFRRIREGTPLADELPWVARVDRFLILVDGKAFATPGRREIVVTRTQRQILALGHSGAVHRSARVALALTKLDELSEPDREQYARTADAMLADLRNIEEGAAAFVTAARPADGSDPLGLDDALEWLSADGRLPQRASDVPSISSSRAIGRLRP